MMQINLNFLKGILWSTLDRGGMLVAQFISLVFLSRFLSSYEFGLIAIVSIFISFATILVDSGLMGSLIRKKKIKKEDLDTLFTYNLITSVVLYILIYLLAPIISSFYDNEILINVIRVMTLSLIINSFGYIQTVILTRNNKFKIQSIITLISQFFSVFISMILAYRGYGVWALVSLQLTYFFVNSLLLCIINRYKPQFRFCLESFNEQMKFGKPLLISNLIFVVNTNLSNSIIGKYYSPTIAGDFYQSSKLQLTPTGILSAVIDKVAFTRFSQIDDLKEFISKTQNFNKIIFSIIFPFCILFNDFSESFFILMLGNKWIEAAEIFYILCLSIIPITVKTLNRNILKSFGYTIEVLKIEIFIFFLTFLCLVLFIKRGILLFSYSIVGLNILVAIFGIIIIKLKFGVSIYRQILDIITPIIKSIALLYIIKLCLNYFSFDFFNVTKILSFIILTLLLNINIIKKYV